MRPGGKAWKSFMAKLYGIGAAVVIVGALFKIQHWPFAGPMLVVGLGVEAIIFFFSAFEKPHEDPDWSLVYPELAHVDDDEEGVEVEHKKIAGPKESITEQLDSMLEEAKIEPELLESLGSGLRSLSDQAKKLQDMGDASVATNDYVQNLQGASSRVASLSDDYAKASEALIGLTTASDAGTAAGEHLQKISANLGTLNNIYELQIKGSSEQLEASNKLFTGIDDMMRNLNESVEGTRNYKDNIHELSKNLGKLNTVYGNMLSAMSGGAK